VFEKALKDPDKHPDGLEALSYLLFSNAGSTKTTDVLRADDQEEDDMLDMFDNDGCSGFMPDECSSSSEDSDGSDDGSDTEQRQPDTTAASDTNVNEDDDDDNSTNNNIDFYLPPHLAYQIEVEDLLARHRCDLGLGDELHKILRKYSQEGKLDFDPRDARSRQKTVKVLEEVLGTQSMKPVDIDVDLCSGGKATVSRFPLEAMVKSLLEDKELMDPNNLAEGYDYLTGKTTGSTDVYGEFHTGDDFEPARKRFCGDAENNMPIAMIIFMDKSHFDRHGALSVTPLCFTLSCFNQSARNRVDFWRPWLYIPNLTYGTPTTDAAVSIQDEHNCIAVAMKELVSISEKGGIPIKLEGKQVVGKPWIHTIIGDTVGDNRVAGHYNSGAPGVARPWRECKCSFEDMADPDPQCDFVTRSDLKRFKKAHRKANTQAERDKICKKMSKHCINNAFMMKGLPLADNVHGHLGMMPPEVLHIIDEGHTDYMTTSLGQTLKDSGVRKVRKSVETTFQHTHRRLAHNSERDSGRGSTRSGVLKTSRVNASEKEGNLFRILCGSFTDTSKETLHPALETMGIDPNDFQSCVIMYLSMCRWFHANNPKQEVRDSDLLVSRVVSEIHRIFPRDGNGWNLQKTHGLILIPRRYMRKLGSAVNFHGGPGETNHKKFVKDAGNNTQGRPNCFSSQAAQRCYETYVYEYGKEHLNRSSRSGRYKVITSDKVELPAKGEGKYIVEVYENNDYHSYWYWKTKRLGAGKYVHCEVPAKFVRTVTKFIRNTGHDGDFVVEGFTCVKLELEGRDEIFRAASSYKGNSWFDWCMVEYEQEESDDDSADSMVTYPAQLFGFIRIKTNGITTQFTNDKEQMYAVVRTAKEPLSWETLENDFVCKVELGRGHEFFEVVPVDSITHPLLVFDNLGGSVLEHFVVLPRRKWARFFGNKIYS